MTKEYWSTESFRPFGVGFDDAVRNLHQIAKNCRPLGYPPYNIVKTGDNKYCIEVAVAGFAKHNLEVQLKENSLVVSGKTENDHASEFLYKGIADRQFERTFVLADTVEVKNTQLINGMLKIFLENIIPEHKKPRKVDID